ncbi:MAG: hypothetical protein ACYDAO_04210 [Thermoplasmataceae archaeon]
MLSELEAKYEEAKNKFYQFVHEAVEQGRDYGGRDYGDNPMFWKLKEKMNALEKLYFEELWKEEKEQKEREKAREEALKKQQGRVTAWLYKEFPNRVFKNTAYSIREFFSNYMLENPFDWKAETIDRSQLSQLDKRKDGGDIAACKSIISSYSSGKMQRSSYNWLYVHGDPVNNHYTIIYRKGYTLPKYNPY